MYRDWYQMVLFLARWAALYVNAKKGFTPAHWRIFLVGLDWVSFLIEYQICLENSSFPSPIPLFYYLSIIVQGNLRGLKTHLWLTVLTIALVSNAVKMHTEVEGDGWAGPASLLSWNSLAGGVVWLAYETDDRLWWVGGDAPVCCRADRG